MQTLFPPSLPQVFGRFLLPPERTDFVLVVLKGMVHPRVSDIRPVRNMLEMVLGDSWSDLNKVGSAQLDCPVRVPSWGRSPPPRPKFRAWEHPTGSL